MGTISCPIHMCGDDAMLSQAFPKVGVLRSDGIDHFGVLI